MNPINPSNPSNPIIIDPTQDPRWDKFVENHPFGWIVHLSGWKQVLENSFKHMKGHYLALIDTTTDDIQAALPLFEVRSWLIGNRLVSIPFATLCDPLITTTDDMSKLFAEALNLSKELKTPSIEIRAFMSVPLIQEEALGKNPSYKHHYILLDKEPEELKKSFHRTNVRQRIQRALKSNLSLKVADNESDMINFYQLHTMTRKKIGLPPQPYTFFKQLWKTFSPSKRMVLLLAERNNITLAGLILFKFKDRVSAEFLASDEQYLNVSPNHLLFWEAIKSAYDEGYKIFDFGRTSPYNETLISFKNRWGTTVADLPQFCYPKKLSENIADRETSTSYKLINKICRNSPESVCKLLGQICYKHLG